MSFGNTTSLHNCDQLTTKEFLMLLNKLMKIAWLVWSAQELYAISEIFQKPRIRRSKLFIEEKTLREGKKYRWKQIKEIGERIGDNWWKKKRHACRISKPRIPKKEWANKNIEA